MATDAATIRPPLRHHGRSLEKRLRQGSVWTLTGRTTGMAVVMVTYVVLARTMPTTEFATFVLASSVVVFLSKLAMFGLNTFVCRYIAEGFGVGDAARSRRALYLAVRIGIVSITVAGFGGWFLIRVFEGLFVDMPGLRRSAGVVALWIALLAISQILAEVFRGLHDLRTASVLTGVSGGLASNALFLSGTMLLSFVTPIRFFEVALLSVASLVLPSLYAVALLRRRWPQDVDSSADPSRELTPLSLASVLRETFPIMLVQVFSFGLAQIDIWIVGACCSGVELAVYGVARRLALLVAIPLTQANLVVSSSVSELNVQGNRAQLETVLRGAATVSAVLTIVLFVVLACFPEFVLEVTFGSAFQSAAAPLRILLWGQLIFALTGPCGLALMMTGHQRISLWSLLATATLFAAAPSAAAMYGLEAVALISALAIGIHNVIQWVATRALLRVSTHPCLRRSFLCAILSKCFQKSCHRTVGTNGPSENRRSVTEVGAIA